MSAGAAGAPAGALFAQAAAAPIPFSSRRVVLHPSHEGFSGAARERCAIVDIFRSQTPAPWLILLSPQPSTTHPLLCRLAFLVVMLAHLAQSFVGAWIAARVGASRPMLLAMIVGVLWLVGGIAAMMMIEGPTWMVVELPLYLVVAWITGRLEQRRQA
jgi:hypothetical protein